MLDIHGARNASMLTLQLSFQILSLFVFLMIYNSFSQRFLNSQPILNDIFRKEKNICYSVGHRIMTVNFAGNFIVSTMIMCSDYHYILYIINIYNIYIYI